MLLKYRYFPSADMSITCSPSRTELPLKARDCTLVCQDEIMRWFVSVQLTSLFILTLIMAVELHLNRYFNQEKMPSFLAIFISPFPIRRSSLHIASYKPFTPPEGGLVIAPAPFYRLDFSPSLGSGRFPLPASVQDLPC